MALFTDGRISNLADLEGYDSAILEVAKTESINLSTKLQLAETELGLQIESFLLRKATSRSPRQRLGQVVVTDALRRWHTLNTLALTYGDAFNSQLNDRYRGKWKEYQRLSRDAGDLLFQGGVGIVHQPIPRAKPPQIALVNPGSLTQTTHIIQVAWRSARAGSGAASEEVAVVAQNGEQLEILAIDPPPGAESFDVFAGFVEGETMRQNTAPIPAMTSFTLIGVIDGPRPGPGQSPDFFLYLDRVLQRG
jgi:hypothetical protein